MNTKYILQGLVLGAMTGGLMACDLTDLSGMDSAGDTGADTMMSDDTDLGMSPTDGTEPTVNGETVPPNDCMGPDCMGGAPEMWPCESELDLCLQGAGEDPAVVDRCFIGFDECSYQFECVDPNTGDDWCMLPPQDECLYFFDECLTLGVSEQTCQLAVDECIAAQQPPPSQTCDLQLADCIYAGLDMNFCMAGYDACALGQPVVEPPPAPLPPEVVDACEMGYEQCMSDGHDASACQAELDSCVSVMPM